MRCSWIPYCSTYAALGLFLSVLKDRGKTAMALKKAWKAFEGILPQFLAVLFLVAAALALLMKNGASFTNILVFIGAWSTTKMRMPLFEMAALGKRFSLSRLAIDIVGIVIIAWAIKLALPRKEVDRLYAEAEHID